MKKYFAISSLSLLFLIGCSKFDDINNNPNQPSSVRSDLLLNNLMYTAFAEDGDIANSTGSYSTFVGGDMGGCWAQHLSKVQYNDEERYSPRVGIVQDFWETYYEDVVDDAQKMYDLAGTESNKAMQGVARVMGAYGFQVLTDCYGDIPFTEALKSADANFTPKYDAQEDVYVGILAMLDEANTLLTSGSGSIPATSDKLYGGSIAKWTKLANSLKFRALMRVSGKSSAKINVASDLQDIIDNRSIFASNADEAKFAMGAAQPAANPFYETIIYGNRSEWKVNSVLVDMLTNLNDPRLPVYAQPAASDGAYRGKPSGYDNLPSLAYGYSNISAIGTKFLQPTAPGYFMSYAELCFLMAEAAQRSLISGVAATYYNNGITASMNANGITSSSIITSYLALTAVDLSTGNELKKIREQNWVALFGQGVESWTEWRRTKTPTLSPAVDGAINEIPSRYQYPTTEQSLNKANYDAAIARQGADLLTTKIWWIQ